MLWIRNQILYPVVQISRIIKFSESEVKILLLNHILPLFRDLYINLSWSFSHMNVIEVFYPVASQYKFLVEFIFEIKPPYSRILISVDPLNINPFENVRSWNHLSCSITVYNFWTLLLQMTFKNLLRISSQSIIISDQFIAMSF